MTTAIVSSPEPVAKSFTADMTLKALLLIAVTVCAVCAVSSGLLSDFSTAASAALAGWWVQLAGGLHGAVMSLKKVVVPAERAFMGSGLHLLVLLTVILGGTFIYAWTAAKLFRLAQKPELTQADADEANKLMYFEYRATDAVFFVSVAFAGLSILSFALQLFTIPYVAVNWWLTALSTAVGVGGLWGADLIMYLILPAPIRVFLKKTVCSLEGSYNEKLRKAVVLRFLHQDGTPKDRRDHYRAPA